MAGVDLVPPLGYDPEKVKLILDSAGWLMGGDGVRRKNGVPLVSEPERLKDCVVMRT